MDYFDDFHVTQAGIYPNYRGHIQKRRPTQFSLELVASGRMYFQRNAEERIIIDYPALRWHSPEHIYAYGSLEDAGWEHYFILFEGERAKRLYHKGFEPLVTGGCVLPIRRVDLFRKLFTTIHDHVMHPGLDTAQAAFYTEELLIRAIEESREPTPLSRYLPDFEHLSACLRNHPGQHVDFRQAAANMGISYSHFRTLFTDYAGMPPHQYLLRTRLAVAAELLQKTNEPIKQLAYELGLGNPAQFSKAFRAKYSLPPAAYRSENKRRAGQA